MMSVEILGMRVKVRVFVPLYYRYLHKIYASVSRITFTTTNIIVTYMYIKSIVDITHSRLPNKQKFMEFDYAVLVY